MEDFYTVKFETIYKPNGLPGYILLLLCREGTKHIKHEYDELILSTIKESLFYWVECLFDSFTPLVLDIHMNLIREQGADSLLSGDDEFYTLVRQRGTSADIYCIGDKVGNRLSPWIFYTGPKKCIWLQDWFSMQKINKELVDIVLPLID